MEPAYVKNLDPPMVAPPYPAGFPLAGETPRLLSEFSVSERNIRQVGWPSLERACWSSLKLRSLITS